jgi:hypothetical protein
MKKLYFLLALTLITFLQVTAQITVTGSTGADGTAYTSLTKAGGVFAALNAAGAQTGNTITISIGADVLDEDGANELNDGGWTAVTIAPTGGAARTLAGNVNLSLISLNGADNVRIDGLKTGGNDLTISNASTGSAASAIRFTADASNNTVTNATINGSGGASISGVGTIQFAAGTTTGNDNNTINNCDIGAASGGTPLWAIYSFGQSTTADNSNISITNNRISNFFNAGLASAGINVNTNSSAWTITGNSFFQTATRTSTSSNFHYAIFLSNSGSGFTISNNTIGGSNATATGTAWTLLGAFTNRFVGISVLVAGTATTSIQGNTISNFSTNTTSGSTTGAGIFSAISVSAGNANIGNITGNTIGATTGNGNITVNATTTGGTANLISYSGSGTGNISNNTVGAINLTGNTATIGVGFNGIYVSGGVPTITNNTIGSTATANSINSSTVATGTQAIAGIQLTTGVSVTSAISINNNIVANITGAGTAAGSFVRGIVFFGQTASGAVQTVTINNNQINNLRSASANVTPSASAGVAGIVFFPSSTSSIYSTPIITNNVIYNVIATNTGALATNVIGIGITNSANGNISRNRIYDLRNASTGTSATTPPTASGIYIRASIAGTATTIHNNMIALGIGQTTNTEFVGIWQGFNTNAINVYYNSVTIGGTAASGAFPSFGFLRGDNATTSALTTPVSIINNIFNNARNGGTGPHYAIGNNYGNGTSNATGWSANNNLLNSAVAANVGYWSGTRTFAAWQTSSAGDAASLTAQTVNFVDAATADLHLNFGTTPTQIESAGTVVAGFTTDYDNDNRPGPTGSTNGGAINQDMGADEFDGVPSDVTPPTITFANILNTTCITAGKTLTATITDAFGVNILAGTKPRVYFKKATEANTFAGNTSADNGWKFIEATNAASPFTFTLDYSLLNSPAAVGDNIQYFVVAQDNYSTPNTGIANGTFAGAPTSVALTAAAFPIGGTISNYNLLASGIPANVTIGAAGTYPSLTGTTGLFAAINSGGLTNNVTAEIIDASVTETGAIALNQMASGDCSAGGFTLLVKPQMGVTTTLTGSLASAALIKINSSNVTIDGSANSTTTRDLTITNTSTTLPSVVAFGSVGTTPIINVALKNSVIINGATTNTAVFVSSNVTSNAGYFNNVTIQNNDIRQAFIGIYAIAVPATGNGSGLLITQNNLNTTGAQAIRRIGIYVQGVDGATVTNNTIGNFEVVSAENDAGIWLASATTNSVVASNTISSLGYTGTAAQGPAGIYITTGVIAGTTNINKNIISNIASSGSSGVATRASGIAVILSSNNVTVNKNNITNIKNSNTAGWGCSGINLATGANANVTVSNNFVSDVAAYGFDGLFEDDNGNGITIASGSGYNIYNNTINLNTNQTEATGRPACILVTNAVSAAGAINLRNNILSNTATGGSTQRYAIASSAPNTVFAAIDYNNYYTTGANLANIGATDRATLADVITGFGGNANSLNVAPVYTSATDLHLLNTANCALDNKGTPIATITDDIDDQARATLAPDMGADEFTANASNTIYNTPTTTVTDIVQIDMAQVTFKHTNCESFASVTPVLTAATPIAGAVTGRVYKYATPQTYLSRPFVERVIDITPVTNATSAAGIVTLFYTQAEFDAYNAVRGAQPALPTDGLDAAGIANVRVTKFSGTPLTTPSQPGQYSGGGLSLINPADADIIFNTTDNRWEVSINIVGFSGFYLHTGNLGALAINVNYLNGVKVGNNNNLSWKVNCTSSTTATMVLERSNNNKNFTAISTQTATAARCAQPFDFVDATATAGINYYRLRVTDDAGRVSYSNVVALQNGKDGLSLVSMQPNPAKTIATLNIASAKAGVVTIVITDVVGKQIATQNASLIAGSNMLPINVASLAPGTYQLTTFEVNGTKTTLRFVKQ